MHALFCHPDKFVTRFDKKICGEDRPQITDWILIISKQLESVPLKRKKWYMLLWKRNRRVLLGSLVVSSSAITFFTYSNISPTLVNINMLSFPNICIISPLKAHFDYVAKPFVTINFHCRTLLLSLFCWENCRYLNLITLVEFWLNKVGDSIYVKLRSGM